MLQIRIQSSKFDLYSEYFNLQNDFKINHFEIEIVSVDLFVFFLFALIRYKKKLYYEVLKWDKMFVHLLCIMKNRYNL